MLQTKSVVREYSFSIDARLTDALKSLQNGRLSSRPGEVLPQHSERQYGNETRPLRKREPSAARDCGSRPPAPIGFDRYSLKNLSIAHLWRRNLSQKHVTPIPVALLISGVCLLFCISLVWRLRIGHGLSDRRLNVSYVYMIPGPAKFRNYRANHSVAFPG
jgi:hypothetical protein